MKKVLVTVTDYSLKCIEAKKLLEQNGCEIIENRLGRPFNSEELQEAVRDADGAVVGSDVWDAPVFKAARKLKIVSRFGVGYDNVDIEAATKAGVMVTNVKAEALSTGVAELTVGLIIDVLRNIPGLSASTKNGGWERPLGLMLKGRSVGLVGFGAIAGMVARMLNGFDVNISAYDKYPDLDKAKAYNVKIDSLEHILKDSDIISLHIPSMKETYHMMGREQFAAMKAGAYFINTARGALVDEEALYDALKSGKLKAAAIDVYEKEPPAADNPLFQLDNVICTPHIASETYENVKEVGFVTARALLAAFGGRVPDNLLNA